MDQDKAEAVVAALRERGVFAHLASSGVYRYGIRVVIPDGREAIWDTDDTASLEAQVMRDGVLVGFVPQVPDSEDLDVAQVVDVIARTDYDTPIVDPPRPRPSPTSAPTSPPRSAAGPPTPRSGPPPPTRQGDRRGLLDQLRRRLGR